MWTNFNALLKLTDPQGALRAWHSALVPGEPVNGHTLRLEGRFAQSRAEQLLAALVHFGAIEPLEHDPGELTAQGKRDSMLAWTYVVRGPWPEEGAEYASTDLLWEDRVGHWHVAKSTTEARTEARTDAEARRPRRVPWTSESYAKISGYHAQRAE